MLVAICEQTSSLKTESHPGEWKCLQCLKKKTILKMDSLRCIEGNLDHAENCGEKILP